MKHIIVVDRPQDWRINIPGVDIVSSESYISDVSFSTVKRIKIFNLCRSYKYQSAGYYVSLLAQARKHYAIPSVTSLQDIKIDSVVKQASHDIDLIIQNSFKNIKSDYFELSIYFGKNIAKAYSRLSSAIFNMFPVPFLRVYFRKIKGKWFIDKIKIIATKDIPESHYDFMIEKIKSYFGKKDSKNGKKKSYKYELAVLIDKSEKFPPSDIEAIEKFMKAANRLGMGCTYIGPNDLGTLDRYDALFIRATTAVNHFTYRFARRAEVAGLAVIDDPLSIIRCTNKAFLSEAAKRQGIAIPESKIVDEDNLEKTAKEIGYPLVLKIPDSSFSRGVFKINSYEELKEASSDLFKLSELLLIQKFVPTIYDWRIGILNGQPLFACKYYMVKDHWQIYKHFDQKTDVGSFDTVKISDVPAKVLDTAILAAKTVGDGLYGVDIKETDEEAILIEINDNPNIDAGVEDKILKNELYEIIIKDFIRRINFIRKGINGI